MGYFGKSSHVTQNWVQKLDLSDEARSYKKMTKDGCLYLCSSKQNKRSDNTFVRLDNGAYVRIIYFIVDKKCNAEYVMAWKIKTLNAFGNRSEMIKEITSKNVTETAVITNAIDKVCVYIPLRDREFFCTLPNLCSYWKFIYMRNGHPYSYKP